MKKYFTHMLALVCCLAASLTANAKHSKTFEQYPRTDYATDALTLSLTDLATTLGTDTTTLVDAFEAQNTEVLYLDGAEDKTYNCDPIGYYLDAEGQKCDWGDENSRWFIAVSWDAEADEFALNVGQHSNRCASGDEMKAVRLILAMNGKQVTFDIGLKIKTINVPTPTMELSKLNIVGKKTATLHQYARTGYDADSCKVDLTGVAALLGANAAELQEGISAVLLGTTKDTDNESSTFGFLTDQLTNVSTAGAPGYWFTNLIDNYDEFVSGAYADGYFFAERFSYDAETEQLLCFVGQYPGKLPINIEDEQGVRQINDVKARVFIVWGDKAYELTINLVIDEREKLPFDQMTEVGSEEIVKEMYPDNSYSNVSFTLDVDAIAAMLDVDTKDLQLWAASGEGDATDASTGERGGFWFAKETGYVCGWGSSAGICANPDEAGDYSSFKLCQYPNAFKAGEVGKGTLYLIGGNQYYTVHVTLNVIEKPGPDVEFTSVAERTVRIQAVPSTNVYPIDMSYTIDFSEMEALIGTSSPTLYAREAPAEGESWTGKYSDAYSCNPKPGFWMSSEGYAATWGSSPWGFSYQEAEQNFIFFQLPNTRSVGDEFNAPVYLVNVSNGKMITYNINLRFVADVTPEDETVGTEDILCAIVADKNIETEIDVTKALEALELQEGSQLTSGKLVVLQADGTFSNEMNAKDSFFLTDGGALDTSAKGDEARLDVAFVPNDTKSIICDVYELSGTWAKDDKVVTKVGFVNSGKRYVYNISFVSEEVYTGVTDVHTAADSNVCFDLSGRRIQQPAQRGIYIVSGKKVVLK